MMSRHVKYGRRVCSILTLVLLTLVTSGVPVGGNSAASDWGGGGQFSKVFPDLSSFRAVTKPAGRLESSLDQLVREQKRGGNRAALAFARSHLLEVRDGTVQVVVEAKRSHEAAVRLAIQKTGGKITSTYANLTLAQVPIEKLTALSISRDILQIRRPTVFRPDVTSEGVAETGANTWHTQGIDGTGVKIGIIDGGFSGYPAKLGSELPSTVTVWGAGSAGPEDGGDIHGTAVAEVVHDMAPGASLYLARIGNEVDLGNAKDWMISQGVKVINMSGGFYGTGPLNGTGIINNIVTDAVSQGVFWANAAGNERKKHWMGDFTDPDSDDLLNWDNSSSEINTFWANAGEPIVGVLWWNDSWTNASQDYDFYLLGWTGSTWSLVDYSRNFQDGNAGREPVEMIGILAPASTGYTWVVAKYSATQTNVDFDLFSIFHDLDDPSNPNPHFFDHARSILVPADNSSNGFIAAAAIGRAPSFAQELYSSEGPTRDSRLTPEIAAPSSVTNSVYGTFGGTSASSPHLTGAAALVKQVQPSSTPADIETYLESNAVDLGAAGPDTQYGNGRLDLPIVGDTQAPVQVTNLAMSSRTSSSITLTWTAPGDDGNTGTASQYDIRYSTSPITEGNWAATTQVTGEPTPQPAGSTENFTVSSLDSETTYYFALKTSDEVPNWSTISNIPAISTLFLGDINGDGRVSLIDLTLLAEAYGTRQGDANYNPDADLNGDGRVSLIDLTLLAEDYGKSV